MYTRYAKNKYSPPIKILHTPMLLYFVGFKYFEDLRLQSVGSAIMEDTNLQKIPSHPVVECQPPSWGNPGAATAVYSTRHTPTR